MKRIVLMGYQLNLIIEVYDSTALARITKKGFPWVELEIGDRVALK
ncbi:MAG: hypothetical protein V1775_08350 [Bacteroidota bacterium]